MYLYIVITLNVPRYITINRLFSPSHDVSLYTAYSQHPTMYHYLKLTFTNAQYIPI